MDYFAMLIANLALVAQTEKFQVFISMSFY